MIVSHRHRFVFAAIPKTGTHSVRQALRMHMGPEDIEQVGLFVDRKFPHPELAKIGHGHLSLAQVRPWLGEETFGDYFKFAFVRNPYDRFVSYCAFVTRDTDAFQRMPREVMREIACEIRPLEHVLFRPQCAFVQDADGTTLADEIGRVEDMQAAYARMCGRIGIPADTLGRVNGTKRGSYRQYYDDALAEAVTALYRRDLELFGYSF